jgi:flagellin
MMASQVINTNIASLTAQRHLDVSSDGYSTCLERLSSGLRINSAKDDAAGLAIATRMESTISGSIVAKRNCNDAVSLAQIAEGALQETTNMLVRIRELAVQSANGTNAAQDRYSLNEEVNQLLAQLSMSASQTTFNGLNLLDGTLAAASFQVGPEQYQSVTISIQNTNPNEIGINNLTPTGSDGAETATYGANYGTLIEEDVVSISNLTTNNIAATSFTFYQQTDVAGTSNMLPVVAVGANETTSHTVSDINADLAGYVQASAYTDIFISGLAYDNGHTFTLAGKDENDVAIAGFTIAAGTPNVNYSYIASQINNTNTLADNGIYAIASADGVRIISPEGHDLTLTTPANSTTTYNITQYNSAGASVATQAAAAGANSYTAHGLLTLEMAQNISLGTGVGADKDANAVFFDTNQTTYNSGILDSITTNRIQKQTITLSGNNGDVEIPLVANSSAAAIATAINNQTGATSISATATTSLNIQGISATGTVSFELFGDNPASAPVTVSASVTTDDYSNLVISINNYYGATGIYAKFDSSNSVITLYNTDGNDIRIENFQHSAGVAPQNVTTTKLGDVDGSTLLVPNVVSMQVVGNPSINPNINNANTITLYTGGARNQYNSTVVNGLVNLASDNSFSVSSSVDGTQFSGGLFTEAALTSVSSGFSALSSINISTADGAIAALPILDQTIDQINGIRAALGAIQARFESAINNLAYSIDNISAAKSRVMDADFALETSQLSRTQMLTQAGLAMVAQANDIPRNILSLLQ